MRFQGILQGVFLYEDKSTLLRLDSENHTNKENGEER